MIAKGKTVTISGIVEADGRLRLDGPVPVEPGPVQVTVRSTANRRDDNVPAKPPMIADMAGVGGDLWRKINVDDYLQQLRDEWDGTGH